ncbi:GntR family transcriptional regulator [Humibacter ginsenosidimutans]|uniref:GntR family transcriptional regulator n=1 Tax=Humibacter ginsenosidimutans TaxID=2599293 RepID=A0A5B8M8J7_9MICO|nr:GntR family transcriptional regulator [Humibacter ginsenosidimutans]QDZ15760.1 GntR family transcriptional regulator [Humibacter ginsenosidimutans]
MSAASQFEPEAVRVTARLRDEIIDGVRPPGSKLVEREIAEEFGVSRVPVRDALKALITEGLVTPRVRSWAVVRRFTPSDLADLSEVRSALEMLAFRLAAARHTREGLAALRTTLDAELAAAYAGDVVAAHRAGADFHERVVDLTGNETLLELERVMRSRLRWLMGRHADLLRVAKEHEALYDAIAARDVDKVVDLVARHLQTSHELATEVDAAEAEAGR